MAKKKLPTAPAKDLVLEALHAIRKDIHGLHEEQTKTNQRLDQAIGRLDKTVDRLDRLESRATKGFLDTNTKLADLTARVDETNSRLEGLSSRVDQLGDRLENVFTVQLGQDVRDLKDRIRVIEAHFVAHERPPNFGKPEE